MNNKLTLEGIEYELVPTAELTVSSKPGHPPIIIIESEMFLGKAIVDKQVSQEEKREWEVISFRDGIGVYIKKENLYVNGGLVCPFVPSASEILSVKRLSDGEVFSVGDYVNMINAHKITRIIIGGAPQNHERNKNLVWLSTSGAPYHHGVDLMVASKYKGKPIFEKYDGVKYFEGQEREVVFGVNKKRWTDTSDTSVRFAAKDYSEDWIFFSAKYIRHSYEIKNKPTLSHNDIIMFLDAIKMEIPAEHMGSFIKMIESKL